MCHNGELLSKASRCEGEIARGEKKKALPLKIIIECDGSGRDHNGIGNFIALTRDCFISLFISSSRWRNFEGEKWRVLH